jgi:C-terminal processing protease CtpA/Prc
MELIGSNKLRSHKFGMKIIVCLMLVTIYHIGFVSPAVSPPVDETSRIERLVGLAKLWGFVKIFHPFLAYRSEIDWDGALVAAIPRVMDAKTPDEYASYLNELLKVLGDPSTRIILESGINDTENSEKPGDFNYLVTPDAVLVIEIGDCFSLSSPAVQTAVQEVVNEIPEASAVVIDLRSPHPIGEYGRLQVSAYLKPIERMISPSPISTPGERTRIHYGFDGHSVFSSGQYKSGLFTRNGKIIAPVPKAKDIPIILILNEHSGWPESAPGWQAAGKCLIVYKGPLGGLFDEETEDLRLGDGIIARVRISEAVFENGMSGELLSDIDIPVSIGKSDMAMETALDLVRNFKPSTAVRKKLPAEGVSRSDPSYPELRCPPLEYRLLAAFRIWTTIHYFFPYKHLMEEDWEDVLYEFIPRFEQAEDELSYSMAIAEMVVPLHDSHAYVSGEVYNEFLGAGFPPVRVRLIQNTPVVTSVMDEDAVGSEDISVGDIVLEVDGEDAMARLSRYAGYFSASTPQSLWDKASRYFLNGRENSFAALTLRDSENNVKEVRMKRRHEDYTTLYHRERTGEIIKIFSRNIGYADLDRLTIDMVDEMFERLKNTEAIIFDMRGYPNGTVWSIAPRLTETPGIRAALFKTPLVGRDSPPGSSEAFYQIISSPPSGKWTYKGRTVLLIDERTMSQAEHTGLFLKAANGTKFIGSATAGADGEITVFSLPGGIAIGFTGQSVEFPDGSQLQRIGLTPDVEASPTIGGIRKGRDEVLEKAIDYLLKKKVDRYLHPGIFVKTLFLIFSLF